MYYYIINIFSCSVFLSIIYDLMSPKNSVSFIISVSLCVFQLVVVYSVPGFCWAAFIHCPSHGLTTYLGWPTSPCLPICINRSLDPTVTRQLRRGVAQPPCRNQATNPLNEKPACQCDKYVQSPLTAYSCVNGVWVRPCTTWQIKGKRCSRAPNTATWHISTNVAVI